MQHCARPKRSKCQAKWEEQPIKHPKNQEQEQKLGMHEDVNVYQSDLREINSYLWVANRGIFPLKRSKNSGVEEHTS
jgi:hypothetical protein